MKKAIPLLLITAIIIAGCTQSEIPPTPTNTATIIPTMPPPATPTPTSIPTPEPLSGQEILIDEWRPAFWSSLELSGACSTILAAAVAQQAGTNIEINLLENTYFTGLFAGDLIGSWDADDSISQYKAMLIADLEEFMEVVSQWYSDGVIPDGALDTLTGTCGSLNDIQEKMKITALDSGMTEGTLHQLISEIESMLEIMAD